MREVSLSPSLSPSLSSGLAFLYESLRVSGLCESHWIAVCVNSAESKRFRESSGRSRIAFEKMESTQANEYCAQTNA